MIQSCLSILLAAYLFETSSADSNDDIPIIVCDKPANKHRGILRGLVRHAKTGKPLRDVKLEFDHSQGRCVAATDPLAPPPIAV